MDTEALSKRRIKSTLIIGLTPLILGVLIYGYWLQQYYSDYNISPTDGLVTTLGFWVLVLAVPANILGIVFLIIPWKKNRAEIQANPRIKNKYFALFALLGLNYFVAGGILYNFIWLNNTVSVELTNNYGTSLRDIIIILPNGDANHMNFVALNQTGHARVFNKGEGPVEMIVENKDGERVRATILSYITSNMGGRVKVTLNQDFSIKSYTGNETKSE